MNSVYIIDFSNFLYKFKSVYSFARLERDGLIYDTSALVGFTRCLKSNIAKDIIIVLDGIPSRSLAILPGYKGQRQHDETKQYLSVPKLEVIKFLTKIGEKVGKNISVVCSPLQETDEVISSLVHHITGNIPAKADFISRLNSHKLSEDRMLKYLDSEVETEIYKPNYNACIIGSTDGDFVQLQRFPNVAIDKSSTGKDISTHRTTKSTSQLSPIATIAYKAIYGDESDNIPGIKLSLKKSEVLEELNTLTDATLDNFMIMSATGKQLLDGKLGDIAYTVYKSDPEQFKVNWSVTYLVFRSYPIKLTYPSYNIDDTIQKYRIRL